jgi:hypothetical protein
MQQTSKQQFQLGLVRLFSAMALLVLIPFTLWRLYSGDYLRVSVNMAIFSIALISFLYSYRAQKVDHIGALLAISLVTAVLTLTYINQPLYMAWLHPVMFTCYFLLPTALAILLTAISIAAINSPGSVTLSGNDPLLAEIEHLLGRVGEREERRGGAVDSAEPRQRCVTSASR